MGEQDKIAERSAGKLSTGQPSAQSPTDIADAIVDAALTGKTDVVVGMAQVATSAYQFLPGLIGPLLKNTAGR